jgi:L-arabinose isomerase
MRNHGAQDTGNALVLADRPFHVITEIWQDEAFAARVDRWARAARAVTAWRTLRVAVFGYAMNHMGDIRVDENALLRSLGPEISFLAPGDLYRGSLAVTADEVAGLRAWEDEHFDIDPKLSDEEREDHLRMRLAIERMLVDGGYRAYSAPTTASRGSTSHHTADWRVFRELADIGLADIEFVEV